MQEEIFGPVLVSTTFRTPAEAVALANNTRYGLAATVWSENINLALDIAPKLAAGDGLDQRHQHVRCRRRLRRRARERVRARRRLGRAGRLHAAQRQAKSAQANDRAARRRRAARPHRPDREALYRRQAGASRRRLFRAGLGARTASLLGHVALANRKDVRNAVEAAHAASGWSKTTGHLRAQILYYIAENLSARAGEFARRIDAMLGGKSGKSEVEASVRRLFTYAAWADKYDGQVHGVPIRGVALAMNEPVGVIGAICPDEAPLLGLISCMAPAIAMGNRVILSASEVLPAGCDGLLSRCWRPPTCPPAWSTS